MSDFSHNLDKIIQLVLTEQLKTLLQQVKPSIIDDSSTDFNQKIINNNITSNTSQVNSQQILDLTDKITQLSGLVNQLQLNINEKFGQLEEQIITNAKNNNVSTCNCMTHNTPTICPIPNQNIVLNINEILHDKSDSKQDDVEEEEEVVEEEVVEEEEEVVEEEEEEVVEEEEEVVEEEEEEVVEDEKVVEEEVEEADEEVFEIEIDDITYFATDETNGILYAVDESGDVGKQVGILKDGEPIFS